MMNGTPLSNPGPPRRAGLRKALILIALALPLSSCDLLAPSESRDRAELEHHWRVWQARRADSYTYVQQRLCYCLAEAIAPVLITVRDDVVLERRYAEQDIPIPLQLASFWGTIDDLFRLVEDAINMDAYSLLVSYHRTQGYPTHVSIDYRAGVADDELVITVSQVMARSAGQ